LLLKLLQNRRLIEAVVAPRSHDIQHKSFAFESVVGVSHDVAGGRHTGKRKGAA
jgi:hypothetical protein